MCQNTVPNPITTISNNNDRVDNLLMDIQYSCVGCGKCCNDHHVPLTLNESKRWATDGGAIIILVEAFLENGYGIPEHQLNHARSRSLLVSSGEARAYIAITFAAYNAGPCRNLNSDNMCNIYERRPLVCRIYPMEINPHIPLRPATKDCPPHSWEAGPDLIVGGKLVDSELATLIEQSRQADRDEIITKEAICTLLGICTTALKGDGFATYLPDMPSFAAAIEQVQRQSIIPPSESNWCFQLSRDSIADAMKLHGAEISNSGTGIYTFIPLQQVSSALGK